MTEQQIEVIEEEIQEEKNALLDSLRRILMAGVGAVVLAQEEIEDFVNRLVQRGEIAEKDGRRLVNDIVERRRHQVEEQVEEVEATGERAASEVDRRVESVLRRLNVPTKSEIDALSRQISDLSRKVDELKELER